jgi:hypothetical protein
MRFEEALDRATIWMDEIDGVQGVAEGQHEGERCITVFVSVPELPEGIPTHLGKYKVIVEHTGHFFAQSPPES